MTAHNTIHNHEKAISRRALGLMLVSVCLSGCTAPWVNRSEEQNEFAKRTKEVKKLMKSENRPRLLGDAATITGLVPQQFEAFGLVHKLPGTGGDTKPGEPREYVLRELRVREVENPNAVVASKGTAIVKLRANAPAGVMPGDKIDVIVEKSMDCESKDLRNGELMPTRLLELVAIEGKIRQSDMKALAAGQLVTMPPSLNSTKKADPDLAILLGGAKVMAEQMVYIRMNEEVKHIMSTTAATDAINARFDIYDKNVRKGIADAKSDRSIELAIPAKYRADIDHFINVVLSVGFMESEKDRKNRMEECRERMKQAATARSSAHQLEAIGTEAIPILKDYLRHQDKEIQFYAAYALAYLDEPEAVPVLLELAKTEAAFRPHALIGLMIIDHRSGDEALRNLMTEKQPEVCYGALRSLRKRKSLDSVAAGQILEGIGRVTEIASPHSMIAVSLSSEPEIAVFGGTTPIQLNQFYEVNSRMTMRAEGNAIRLAHFRPGDEDLVALAEPNLRSVLQAMYDVRATYSDVIHFLDTAEQKGWINAPVEFNPLPPLGIKYNRELGRSEAAGETKSASETANATNAQYSWWDLRRLFSN